MIIKVEKEEYNEGVYVDLDISGIRARFENVDGVYISGTIDGLTTLHLCQFCDIHGYIVVPVSKAVELIARFKELGVYMEGQLDIPDGLVRSDG